MTVNIKTLTIQLFLLCCGSFSWTQEIKRDTVIISPNPANEYIIIETNKFPSNAAFVDGQGVIQGFIPIRSERTMIDIQNFASGKYYLLISGKSYRFVKN
jgi:hypothetical protein